MTDKQDTTPTVQPAPKIKIWRLTNISDKRAVKAFIDVYRAAFAGPPYFEKSTKKHVLDYVLRPHLKHGLVLIAEVDGKIVGLTAGYPMLAPIHTEIRDFLIAQPKETVGFDPHFAFFESELAVDANIRKIGLGNRLLCSMHRWAYENRFTHYVGRTAEVGSNAVRMHLRNGAKMLPFVQEAGEEEKAVGSAAERKVWFAGDTAPWADYDGTKI
jgi:hypothetical protein